MSILYLLNIWICIGNILIAQCATILESTVVDYKFIEDKNLVFLGGIASGPNKLYYTIIAIEEDTVLHGS